MTSADGRALFVDYGGVLTPGVAQGWRDFEGAHGIPDRAVSQLLWAAYEDDAGDENPIVRLERGELDVSTFEQELAGRFRDEGYDVTAEGLVARLFSALQPDPTSGVWQLVRDVRDAGVATVLLSNSWGTAAYPRDALAPLFDELVLSGEVGMRKPDREIFDHAAELVDADLTASVFIDDAPANVAAAEDYGLTGVLHHGDTAATRAAVLAGLGL